MEFIVYNLKAAMLLTAFYLLYRLFLSKETFLRTNRVVLLAVVALSFILPNCHLTLEQGSAGAIIEDIASSRLMSEIVVSSIGTQASSWFTVHNVVVALYFAGVMLFLARVTWAIIQIVRMLRKGEHIRLDGATLVLNDTQMSPFSWIRYVSMNRKDYEEGRNEILTHELAHINYGHSVDLMAIDIACCIQWFNPAVWLLRRELCAVHEYEADKAVLDSGVNAKQYQILLIKKAAGSKWSSIANSFNHSKLKSRINMMLRKESSVWARAKVLYALPIIGGAMIAFANVACNESEDTTNVVENQQVTDENALQSYAPISEIGIELLKKDPILADLYEQGLIAGVDVDESGDEPVIVRWVEKEDGKYVMREKREVFLIVEEMPEFPGGDMALREFLSSSVRYPQEAIKQKIQGRVFVSFVVDEEGRAVDVHMARKFNPILDAEAIRVVKSMPKWKPGRQRGQNVAVSYTVPINFVLE